ncbi:hypothetical protein [Noviluteimonas gilva]|uniref:Uncharacterized protein n=1 Tax=Noviluteimonas gilva TaxID=2682097 RepID=A0A7C9LI01_9GAMM|nr:hypothetical protein [Lysobacter gilvus]MUV13539.1 hypothetical protein [Lysobacter gilvus]
MNTERKVDVLAVMRRLIDDQKEAWGVADDDLVEATVAVGELIADMRAILAVAERRHTPTFNVIADTARRSLAHVGDI